MAYVESFTHKVRQACWELGGGGEDFTLLALVDELGLEMSDTKRIVAALKDIKRAGVVAGVDRGVYRLANGGTPANTGELCAKMWRLLRMRKVVMVSDFVELVEASENYTKEWLQALARRQIVRHEESGAWRLLVDSVEMPTLDDNARKLRRLRARKKALAKLGEARAALDAAEAAINEMEDGDE